MSFKAEYEKRGPDEGTHIFTVNDLEDVIISDQEAWKVTITAAQGKNAGKTFEEIFLINHAGQAGAVARSKLLTWHRGITGKKIPAGSDVTLEFLKQNWIQKQFSSEVTYKEDSEFASYKKITPASVTASTNDIGDTFDAV